MDSLNLSGQFEYLRRIAEAETGMQLSGPKQPRFAEALEKLLNDGQPLDIDGILADPERHNLLIERLTSALTVGESFFFRNEHHFRALREQVIPAIVNENCQRREIRIWSAGCSTGEEPYSLAILLDQILDRNADWTISVLGTDINPQFLKRAREALYRAWSFRRTEIHEDANYFTKSGDQYQLVSHVRRYVRFTYLNLVKDVYPSALSGTIGLDLILFRNVAIYLRPDIVAAILSRFHRALRPGGWLLLGEAEVALAPREHFEVVRFGGATFFRKPLGSTNAPKTTDLFAAPILPTTFDLPPLPQFDSPLPKSPPQKTLPQHEENRKDQERGLPTTKPRGREVPQVQVSPAAVEQVENFLLRGDVEAAVNTVETIPNRHLRAKERLSCVRAVLSTSSDFAEARRMLNKCVAEEPLLLEAQLLKASLAEEDNHLDEAEAALRRALYIDRRCTIAHFQLAMLQQQRGEEAAAIKSLHVVLNIAKSHTPDALVEHGDGVCYGRLREMAQSIIGS